MPPKDWDNIRDGIAALLDRLIGNTGDTGGSQTAGTVMAKENAILKKIEDLTERQRMFSREQIWGHWTTLGNASGTVRVQYGEMVCIFENQSIFMDWSGKAERSPEWKYNDWRNDISSFAGKQPLCGWPIQVLYNNLYRVQ